MGFWITLEQDGVPVQISSHTEGGTYVVGGSPYAEMSVTYNYSSFWPLVLGDRPEGPHQEHYGLGPWLHGRTAAETLELLRRGAERLEGEPDADYWAKTPGNAKRVLQILISWALQYPDATWNIHGG